MPRVPFLLALLCLPLLVGCDGCRRDPDKEAKEQEAPLADFTSAPPQPFPSDTVTTANGIKPGHWITVSQSLKSNKIDTRGELLSRAGTARSPSRSADSEDVVGTIPNHRPIVLPKGQQRRFDYRILPPIPRSPDQKSCTLSSRFVSAGRSAYFDAESRPFRALAAEEYFFVVLTTRPERFAKFKSSDWIKPFQDENEFATSAANYRLVIPSTKDLLPLAETMLDWTNTAVVLWDDLTPEALTPSQQTAIADWVRFGGRLIVNGADATDAVSKTSLVDLLPLRPTGNIELDADAGTALLEGWKVPSDQTTEKQISLLRSQSGRVAVDGQINPDAVSMPRCGNLILVRSVGRGRVVQPRFDITSDWIADWASYHSFINSALLTRPRRRYVMPSGEGFVRQQYADSQRGSADAATNTMFQIAARDAVLPILDQQAPEQPPTEQRSTETRHIDALIRVDRPAGLGGWTDDSDVVDLYRQILRSESGIEIPKSSLVVRSLGYYLLVLVPINYLIFRLMGRLEYAWLAVPVIAIGGAIWVARAARLDIGFARSQTEIALLELQPEYPRGHLSRVVAIYNSLSSTYEIAFRTIDGCALPVDTETNISDVGQSVFRTSYDEGPSLSGVVVGSNQIRLVHAEQMIHVGGAITLNSKPQLVNESSLELFDALVVDKSESGQVRIAIVGGCGPGATVGLRFRDGQAPSITPGLPMQTSRILRRLAAPAAMPWGSTRLVARVEGTLSGMSITPDTHQTSGQTILLAHLKHPLRAEPLPDINLLSDVKVTPTYQDSDPAQEQESIP